MNWLDFVVIGVIAWLTFSSFRTGIIREAINLIAGIAGIVLAGLFYQDLAEDVKLFTDSDFAANLIAFFLIFGAVFVAGQLAGVALKHTAQLLTLGPADHLLGGIFGLAKAIILVEIFFIVVITYPSLGLGDGVAGSRLAPFFVERIPFLLALLPGEFEDAVEFFNLSG